MDRWQLCQLSLSLVLPLRPDEAAGLLIGDVNFDKGWLGGVTEDAMNREFKKLLGLAGVRNGATLYTLRSSVTTAMHRAKLPHLELRYLTRHAVNDILNDYVTLDPAGAMQAYFKENRPLLDAIKRRADELGLSGC